MQRREPCSPRLSRPYHMDICQLTSEQQEELIEDLLALKDVVPSEESGLWKRRILHNTADNKCAPVASK